MKYYCKYCDFRTIREYRLKKHIIDSHSNLVSNYWENCNFNSELKLLKSLNVLHISFHKGCQNDIEYISEKLGFNLEFMKFTDGVTKNGALYSIGHERAKLVWKTYKDYFNKFDVIITSDTAPISRVFLQNNWKKKLLIWICNRFDYCDFRTRDCNFPDKEYFDLIDDSKNRANVKIFGYTPFENYYCNIVKNINIGNNVIKPIGKIVSNEYKNFIPTNIENKKNLIFIGPYHNDNKMIKLSKKLKELNIPFYNGRYNGPLDLLEFKGVVHIPYAWSNLAIFEAIQLGIIYFIPSFEFLNKIKNNNFFWSPPYIKDKMNISEWYCKELKDCFIYFDSWENLKFKIENTNYITKSEKLKEIGNKIEKVNLRKWYHLLKNDYISILMPIYNGIEFLEESLNSIINQTYKNWEVIIGVNGHQKDSEVYKKAKKYESSKIKVFDLFNIKGKSKSLNKMLDFCNYDWISLLDVDDYWLPEKLEEQTKYIDKYDIIGTKCKYFGDLTDIPNIPVNDISKFNFLNSNPIINSSCLLKKELCYWEDIIGVEDYDLWLRLWKQQKKFFNVPKVLTMHRIHIDSAFNSKGNNNFVSKLRDKYNK